MKIYLEYDKRIDKIGMEFIRVSILIPIVVWIIYKVIFVNSLTNREVFYICLGVGAISLILLTAGACLLSRGCSFFYEVTEERVSCRFGSTIYRFPIDAIVGIKRETTWSSDEDRHDWFIKLVDGTTHLIPSGFGLSPHSVIGALKEANPNVVEL